MPELADVEGFRRTAAQAAGQRIERVDVRAPEVVRNAKPRELARALEGQRLGDPERRGKWLLLPAGDARLILHFGMSGGLAWVAAGEAADAPGPHDRLVLRLDGGELRYSSVRKFGGAWLARGEEEAGEVTGPLGPDAAAIGRREFRERLAGKRGFVKTALMDQEVLAGLGNELSDEILWRARIAPTTKAADLDEGRVDALFDAMRSVLRASVRAGRIPEGREWLRGQREARDGTCPRCGGPLRRSKVGGRTSLWCPRCQGEGR